MSLTTQPTCGVVNPMPAVSPARYETKRRRSVGLHLRASKGAGMHSAMHEMDVCGRAPTAWRSAGYGSRQVGRWL